MQLDSVTYVRFIQDEEAKAIEHIEKLKSEGYVQKADTGYQIGFGRTITLWQNTNK